MLLYALLKCNVSINFRSVIAWHLTTTSWSQSRINEKKLRKELSCYNLFKGSKYYQHFFFFFEELRVSPMSKFLVPICSGFH